MSGNNLYYIYIDTKIKGAIDQLVSYFQTQIFNENDCIYVLCKYYPDFYKYIEQQFKKNNIPFRFFKKKSDIQLISKKVVLYLFNAQSNCGLVSNRSLVHIFVTHGESHKLASVKPILRIYDFVITSGQVGVDRLLKANIFSESDIAQHKVILMGNTFIGQNLYEFDAQSDNLLYAPTWEGGVPSENYSSVGKYATQLLIDVAKKNNISNILIQMHPNLGHRDQIYRDKFKCMLLELEGAGLSIFLNKPKFSFKEKLYFFSKRIYLMKAEPISVQAAFVDISAMEVQLYAKHIPVYVISNHNIDNLFIPNKIIHDYKSEFKGKMFAVNLPSCSKLTHFDHCKLNYFIGYEQSILRTMSFKDRIKWLCGFSSKIKQDQMQRSLSKY